MSRLHRFALVCVLALLGLVSACSTPPTIRDSFADLSNWDFDAQGQVRLDGDWTFWWDKEVWSEESALSLARAKMRVPGYWNTAERSIYPAEGRASYSLRLNLPQGGGPWALTLPDIACSWRLVVNGAVIAEQGRASSTSGLSIAKVRPRVVDLPPGANSYQIYLFVVNEADRVGGIRDSVTVGTRMQQLLQERLAQMDSAFFVGGLVVMAMFNVVVFFLQRRKFAHLWLACFTVFIAARTLFNGPRIVQDIAVSLPFELSSQIEYFCILGALSCFILYLRSLFPDWSPHRVFVTFLYYSLLFAVLLFLLPIKTYASAFIGFYDLPMAVMFFVCWAVSWKAMRRKHEDGAFIFVGMIFLVVGALNDLIYQFYPLPQGYVLGRLLFIFLAINTFLLSRQLSRDYLMTQKQTVELRKLDKLKDDFLARVTHELRTPLNGIVGILDAFRMGDFGPVSDRQSYHLGLLEASGKRLLSMVNSILDFSLLKRNPPATDSVPILLRQAVDFLLPSFYSQLKPGVALVNRVGQDLPAALGDEVKFELVLHHLIQNALQHTLAGTITIEAEVEDQRIAFSIRDTGAGIAEDKLEGLFTPFHQGGDIDTRLTGGLGLGLSVSRQMIQQMGGSLELTSKLGIGTTAKIFLPVCPPARLQYTQVKRIERSIHWERERFEPPVAAPPEGTQKNQEPRDLEGAATILIVDDEPVNLLVLRTFLARLGYRVVEANNGKDAIKQVNAQVVDLVILDIMMPGMSGYEVCLEIRKRFTPARLPVLLLTAKNQVEDLIQGYRVGGSDFLTKPFQRDELQARMELHLKVSRAARSGSLLANKS